MRLGATAPSLPVAGKLGGWTLTQDLGFGMGSPQTLKRDGGEESGHMLPLPLPCLWQMSLMKPKLSGRHHQPGLCCSSPSLPAPPPPTPGQTSEPLNSPLQSLLIHWGGGILQYSCQH